MIYAEVLYDGTSGDPTVIWYDGGGTTGWTVISVHPDALTDPECRVTDNITHFATGEFYGNEFMQVDQMVSLAESWPGSALGVEHWVHYDSTQGRKDENMTSLARINAAFRYAMHLRSWEREELSSTGIWREPIPLLGENGMPVRREAPPVHRQTAQFMKKGLALPVLDVVSWNGRSLAEYCKGSEHERDATRHSLLFLKRIKKQPQLRKEVFPALSALSVAA
jgi:hypothetical protein